MEYQKLGQTDLDISRIGFGCWAIGGHGYGRVDDNQSIKAIETALDLGINFFDTADVYGFGHSETILGKALGTRKSDAIVATKFGINWDEEGQTFKDTRPEHVVQALEDSLRRLKLETISLYQIHWHDGKTPLEDTLGALEKCKQDGKIRYISCSNFTIDLIKEAQQTHRIESLQCRYNILHRENEPVMQEIRKRFNMGVIIYGALGRGILSGKYTDKTEFGADDTRDRDNDFRGDRLLRNLEKVDQLKTIGQRHGKSSGQVAVRRLLENPTITCALLGQKTPSQVKENTDLFGWSLTEEERQQIDRF